LLSKQNTFRYYPALYHTAVGGLHEQSNIPLEQIVGNKAKIVQGTASTLDRKQQIITTQEGQKLPYEILVLAMGVTVNYFGIKGLEEFSYGIKSWEQIRRFKNHLHEQLDADHAPDLNYLIVGAGPTGIELAGALPHYLQEIMHNHDITNRKANITIIEAAPRLLPRSDPRISTAVAKRLQSLGITLKLGQKVEGETADSLMVSGEPIKSHTVVWTAGTANNPFFAANNFALNERGKVIVDEQLRAEEAIYVIGDNAATEFSGLAQTAVRDGLFVAHDIIRRANSQKSEAYAPKKPVSVIPVGPNWAAVEWGSRTFTGIVGWWLREAADWIGFHDLEPWWKASGQWMTEFGEQEDCPICAKKT
jgi:NADH dehydrogenase